jgi:hypothetical protein
VAVRFHFFYFLFKYFDCGREGPQDAGSPARESSKTRVKNKNYLPRARRNEKW